MVGGVFWGSHGFKEERKGDPSSLTEYKGESRENLLPMRGGGGGGGKGSLECCKALGRGDQVDFMKTIKSSDIPG